MKTIVITGGTDGIGRGLAEHCLDDGYDVLVVGRSEAKGEAFASLSEHAHFLPADLSLIEANRRVIGQIAERFPKIDVLVLGARYHRSARTVTGDGIESNFALFYLSRFLFSHGLAGPLRRAEHPVVLNFGGAGLTTPIRWDDLQLEHGYHGVSAMGHAGRLNDLLAVDFLDRHADTDIRYVINLPGVVVTSFAGEYEHSPVTASQVEELRVVGKPVSQAVAEILPFLRPGGDRLTAVREGRRLALEPSAWDATEARRLHDLTQAVLAEHDHRTVRRQL
ncbi:short-chain dehydrogenase/reductase SDR [Candidatus Protofrankia californiensis]|uniref:Short-chain dehydrogenase/reductase SDR n=1 Tax=Candidatus Protofrankia californiensis TaxID=1839754 RepID=A0A1C3NWV7_9ACTN|nr:short-chain dehydrogenase/reductase SDR [Candidatus Protofrankia californiensis]